MKCRKEIEINVWKVICWISISRLKPKDIMKDISTKELKEVLKILDEFVIAKAK